MITTFYYFSILKVIRVASGLPRLLYFLISGLDTFRKMVTKFALNQAHGRGISLMRL